MAKDIWARRFERALNRAPECAYDGVAGKLPDWVPVSWQDKFHVAQRDMILWGCRSGYLTEDDAEAGKTLLEAAKECLDAYLHDDSLPPLKSLNPSIMSDIEISMPTSELALLAHVYSAVEHSKKHGSAAGLELLIGEDAVKKARETKRSRIEARFPSPPDLSWDEIHIRFTSNEVVDISARDQTHRYTYAEMGFKDRRTGDPDLQWVVLRKVFARRSGEILEEDVSEEGFVDKLKHKVTLIRKRLKDFFGLQDDPFDSYTTRPHGYKTKFLISSSLYGSEASHAEENPNVAWENPEDFWAAHPEVAEPTPDGNYDDNDN